jgi:uncharacterized protein
MPEIAPVKLANPGPLGLAAFGVTTIILSVFNAGLLPREALAVVVPLAFAYGGLAQLLAGLLEFKTGNTFGLVAFSSYGAFWLWFAGLQWTLGNGWLKASPSLPYGVALSLLVWGVFTFLMWIVSFRLNKAVFSIFLLLWITFFLLAAADFGHNTGHIGGIFGLITGVDALLVAFIEVLNATAGREVISLGKPLIS